MYLLLLGTLAFAQDATYSTTTTRTSDYGFTSGEDDEKDCEKTREGCVDDLRPIEDFDLYHRELELMIGALEPAHNIQCQTDLGAAMAGGVFADIEIPDAQIWTEVSGDVFTEHWFMDSAWIINNPGASFFLGASSYHTWGDMEPTIDPNQPYVRKQFRNRVLPTQQQVETLLHTSPQVERYAFDAILDGKRIAVMLREVHYDASGNYHDQHDFWVYLDDHECINTPLLHNATESMVMVPWDDDVDDLSPGQFFAAFDAWSDAEHGAVITYTLGIASDSGLLD